MHPIEQLRYVARAGDVDPGRLAEGAAQALAALGRDPLPLVTSCRRLIEFHPSCGPLWWVAAHVLAADDPVATARKMAEDLALDPTGDRLADALPECAIVVAHSSTNVLIGLAQRPDISAHLFGESLTRRMRNELMGSGCSIIDVHSDDLVETLETASLVVLEPRAVGPNGYLVSKDDRDVVDAALAASTPVWMLAGVGRALPGALFDACIASVEERSDLEVRDSTGDRAHTHQKVRMQEHSADLRVLALDAAACLIGPLGPFLPIATTLRSLCPVPKELCHKGA